MANQRGGVIWGCMALVVGLACGPTPGASTSSDGEATSSSGTGEATGATTTGETTSTTPTSGSATTDSTTETGTGAVSSTGDDATTAVGECVVDFAQGLCSEACDVFRDCCKCDGQTLLPGATESCVIATGILTDKCWSVNNVRLDGMALTQGGECGEPDVMWVQFGQGGQQIVELCGDACATYLAGGFGELELEMFCEAA